MKLFGKMSALAAAVVCSTSVMASQTVAQAVKLTTLEWPPYVNADSSGTSTDRVVEILNSIGIDATVQVFPWNRAVNLAAKDPAWLGVYPEYYSEADDADKGGARCLYSKSFGTSPVGFAQRVDAPITWSDHSDLTNYTIGVVSGYLNEARFDTMVANGEIQTQEVAADDANLKKVAAGRIDAAVIDREVMAHLLAGMPALAEQLEFNTTLLAEHGLHICFKNSDAGRALRDQFNAAF
ncbi:substrate-binding periplasmic protein [Pseudophaeobacter arcticus]|jgi:polar amino acid transport system substrate-binding protein|uniref:substrate-binding periplasmic protein n=1 Tax=Pseudophaeobacter arcticus TaxID=385492 RepID=UPI002492F4E4|nr:transporter substrate-binding domain-containing protein [Pseudophaeobacter arcticus]